MNNALIGHTGFVGGNLLRQGKFENLFNSSNIGDIAGKSFSSVWCAGVRAVKWWANQNPEEDKKGVASLLQALAQVRCEHFTLISTVDVFKNADGVCENTVPALEGLHPYGRHRLELEEFVSASFRSHTIIRLPGLFGEGLKKNIIYDFLHRNEVHKIHADGIFQFYDLTSIHDDCNKAVQAGLRLAHFAVEPVSVAEMAAEAFGIAFDNRPAGVTPVRYDMRTAHAGLWGRSGGYMQGRDEVLRRIRAFVQKEKRA